VRIVHRIVKTAAAAADSMNICRRASLMTLPTVLFQIYRGLNN
jgi:hypothetical protein